MTEKYDIPTEQRTFPKMKAELKAKWLEALRSGRYSQTRETLRDPNGHCCLGVLCDVVNPNGWVDDGWKRSPGDEDEYTSVNDLSGSFARYVKLEGGSEGELIQLNDDKHKSFHEIADWIESNL